MGHRQTTFRVACQWEAEEGGRGLEETSAPAEADSTTEAQARVGAVAAVAASAGGASPFFLWATALSCVSGVAAVAGLPLAVWWLRRRLLEEAVAAFDRTLVEGGGGGEHRRLLVDPCDFSAMEPPTPVRTGDVELGGASALALLPPHPYSLSRSPPDLLTVVAELVD